MTDFGGGYRPTGRELRDPVARLVELQTEDGLHHTAIVFGDTFREHEALTLSVDLVESFLEYPMVMGLVELAKRVPAEGVFIYPTGRVWTLGDALRAYRDRYKPIGTRAALEVAVLTAQILGEAGESGPLQGCFSHGNLNPWRIALKTDGQLQVFGHGLGQVDLYLHLSDDRPISAESLRYAPPERVEGQPEDTAADIHSLAVIVYEIVTGKHLYDTADITKLKRMITMSEGTSMLTGGETDLPPKLAKALARAMIYDPDTRVGTDEFAEEMRSLLDAKFATGPTLAEVMEEVTSAARSTRPKAKKLKEVKSSTSMFTPGELAEMADDEDDEDATAQPTSQGRWGKVKRGKAEEADGNEEASTSKSGKRTRRSSRAAEPDEEAKPKRRTRKGAAAEDKPEAEAAEAAKPKRRTRRGAAAEDKPEADKEDEAKPKRRTRRGAAAKDKPEADKEDEAKPKRRTRRSAAAEGKPEAEAAPARRRRRRTAEPEAEGGAATEEPRRRRRRSATAETAASDESPSPRRRRRRTAEAETASSDEAAPKRRRRRSTAETAETAETEKPRRRRRRTATEASDGEPAPRRRRRRTSED